MKKVLAMTINLAGWLVVGALTAFLALIFWPLMFGFMITHIAVKELEIDDNAIVGLVIASIALCVVWLFYLVKLVVGVSG